MARGRRAYQRRRTEEKDTHARPTRALGSPDAAHAVGLRLLALYYAFRLMEDRYKREESEGEKILKALKKPQQGEYPMKTCTQAPLGSLFFQTIIHFSQL